MYCRSEIPAIYLLTIPITETSCAYFRHSEINGKLNDGNFFVIDARNTGRNILALFQRQTS
jgi:hypothetical protein